MLRAAKVMGFALLGTLAAGGAVYFALMENRPLPAAPRAAAPVPPELDQRLKCAPDCALDVVLDPETTEGGYRVIPGRIRARTPAEKEPHETRIHYYPAQGTTGPAPAIVVTPILGGDYEIERIILHDLASHGYHALLVDRRIPEKGTLEDFEVAAQQMMADRRKMIDWLETRPEVDTRRIGAYGVSLGGLMTTALTAVEPRIRAAVIVMAGGPIAEVFAGSVETEARELRERYDVREGAAPEAVAAFTAKAGEVLKTCPLALARYIDPRRVIFFTTRRDTSVPTVNQQMLIDALGNPETLSLPTGHYSAIIYLPVLTSRARDFFARRFADAPAAHAAAR